MKDHLEDYVQNKREEFDLHSPDPGLWKKIEKKRTGRKTGTRKLFNILTRVAAVAAIFILSYAYHEYRAHKKENRLAEDFNEEIYKWVPELKETEFYYNHLVDLKMKELQPYFSNVPGIQEELNRDFSELDSIYTSLKLDLKDNIANDQVLEAMIQNYRLKLRILEELLAEVKNENDYENINTNKKRI